MRRPRVISGTAVVGRGAPGGRLRFWRAGLMAASTLGFGWLLVHRLQGMDPGAVLAALAQVPPAAWAAALAATAVSFWALGQYDVTAHRHMGTGIPAAQARVAGLCGIALSQMLGLGLVTGALVRWRMLPSLGLWQAGRLTLGVSLFFLAGWAMAAAVAVLAAGGPWPGLAAAALVAGAGAAALALWPRAGAFGWPNLFTQGRMLVLAAVDCGAAALAFWCLWSGHAEAAPFAAAFLLALGAGLVSGTPGGIGAFELTLLALLPGAEEAALLAAILAWRGIYFLLPAVLAAGVVLRGPRPQRRADVLAPVPGTPAFPEAGLMRQGLFHPLVAGETLFAAARTAHALVALREPLAGGGDAGQLRALMARAAREARAGILYKAPPRLAAAARAAGLAVLPLAREAWLAPQSFRLEHPGCAGLRRKLRKAAQAGVLARCEAPHWAELARISADWAAARDGEHGFSMGRFEPGYLSGQRLYVARIGARPVGFASFHATSSGWALDLLRPHPAAPEGTAQALVAAAIADAARTGVARLSLAAAPEGAFRKRSLCGRLARACRCGAAADGLRQFKEGFAPRWERLYLIGPGWGALALAGWDIRRAVVAPGPLPAAPQGPGLARAEPAEIGFASLRAAWQRKRS